MRRLCPPLLAVLTALAGCGGESAPVTVLADLDLSTGHESVFDRPADARDAPQRLVAGFSACQGQGVWTLGRSARIDLHAPPTDLHLELTCSTMPVLSAYGQRVTLLWNGQEICDRELSRGWEAQRVEADVPAELVRAGPNELSLRPRRILPDIAAQEPGLTDDRPLGVFLRRLRLTARLAEPARQRWRALLAARGATGPSPGR